MTIRKKITLWFTVIVAILLTSFSICIYWVASDSRSDSFYHRLQNKANNTATHLTVVKGMNGELLRSIDKNSNTTLFHGKVVILNDALLEIYSAPVEETLSLPSKDHLKEVLGTGKPLLYKDGNKEIITIRYTTKNFSFIIIAGAVDEEGLEDLRTLKIILVFGTILAIGISLLLGYLFAGQALGPIANIVKEIDLISESNLNLRIHQGNESDEIAQLATKFNQLLSRLQIAFELQRSFISNASHELRTPLTSIGGQLEIALMNKDLSPETGQLLRSLLEDVRRLSKLTNGLLNLAQTEIDVSKIIFETKRIDEVIWEAKTELLHLHPNYNIEIDFEHLPEDDAGLFIKLNESLLKTAIVNLMDNGCKYAGDQKVVVLIAMEGNMITIKFKDTGIGIAPESIPHIFESFFRATNAKKYAGYGIGLTLSKKIIEMHNGSIHLTSALGKGTTVSVTLPTSVSIVQKGLQ